MRGKRQRVVDTLASRIHAGEYHPGDRLDGEMRLAEEFGVSRGTVRQALSELQHRRLIATETGRGSFVIFDGQRLDQERGWSLSLARGGHDVTIQILGIEAIDGTAIPLLPEGTTLERGIAVRRLRTLRAADGTPIPISLENSTVPLIGPLADLPRTGLIDGSLSTTLARAGLHASHGIQRADLHLLDAHEASILARTESSPFLRTRRTSFDRTGRLVEHVVSLLDPDHFALDLAFGETP